MHVRDVMTRDVVTVDLETPVSVAVSLLARHSFTALPVMGEDRLVGMVSESDLLRHELPPDRHDGRFGGTIHEEEMVEPETVADVMTTPVVAVPEKTDTGEVASLMLDYDVRSVPVVEAGQVTGIVSRRDLIRMLVRDDEGIAREVRRRLDDYSGERDRWAVTVTEGEVTVHGSFEGDSERRVVEILVRTVPGVRIVRTGSRTLG